MGNLSEYWSLSRKEQAAIRAKAYPPKRTVVPWWSDDPVGETEMEDSPGTTVTLYADGRVGLSNPDGLPTELVDGLLNK